MTTFENIYNTFISKINDYKIFKVEKEDLFEEYEFFLKSSFSKFDAISKEEDTYMDFDTKEFNRDLSLLEIEILALGMICSWREPSINNTEDMKMRLNTKDYSQYSQANHLKELESLKILAEEDFSYYITKYNTNIALNKMKKRSGV